MSLETRTDRYVEAAVRAEIEELSSTQGGKNAALNRAAFALGGFISAGAITEDDAVGQLEQACEANGYTKQDGRGAVRATIRSGLRKGMQTPRELPRVEPHQHSTREPDRRQTLAEFAESRKLPIEALEFMGWSHTPQGIAIQYTQRDGSPARTQYRDPTWCGHRFAWEPGSDLPIVAFDSERGKLARELGYVIICEGASDAATAVFAGIPAIGIPGANMVRKTLEAHHLEGVSTVYVAVDTNEVGDPDAGGSTFRVDVPRRLEALGYSGKVHELRMPDRAKDMSELWVRDPSSFKVKLENAMRAASEPPRPPYVTLAEMAAEALRPLGLRLQTGFETLDHATRGGIPLGRVVVIAGAPGAGKSSVATMWLDRFEQQGAAVVYLASDEPAAGIVTRLAQLNGFSRDAIESEGAAGEAVRAGFAQRAQGRLIAVIDPERDQSMCTIEDAAQALDHLAGDRPRVLVVDSLQTAQCVAALGAESARERIDAKLAALKAIAARGGLVLAISEMARGGYRSGDRKQDVSALAAGKESGSIEYGAALLLGLRSVRGEHGLVDVEVAKNRLGGSKPEFRLQQDFERASFAEIAMPDPQEHREQIEDAKAARARTRVTEAIKRKALRTKHDVCVEAGGRKAEVWAALSKLVIDGDVVQVDGVFRLQTKEER